MGDVAKDLVNIEEARLCAEADKAGIRAWAEALTFPQPPKRKWWTPWR